MVTVGVRTTFPGVYALIIGDDYAVSTTLTTISTDPDTIETVTIENMEYYAFHYQAGGRFMTDTACVKVDSLPYRIFDAVIDKGKVPWYLDYLGLSELFDSAKKYCGVNLDTIDHAIFEMVAAVISRQASDRSKFYRHGKDEGRPAFIPMRSVQYGASNTTAKLIGAYWSEGLMSSLVHPSERKELIEDLLRA